jgi:hypothetical protein
VRILDRGQDCLFKSQVVTKTSTFLAPLLDRVVKGERCFVLDGKFQQARFHLELGGRGGHGALFFWMLNV